MGVKTKVKMCPFCEGDIDINATVCKYCGSSLNTKPINDSLYETGDSLASLYDPPYAPNKRSKQHGVPYNDYKDEVYENKNEEKNKENQENTDNEEEERSSLSAILFLSIGSTLFTIAWFLFFFSDNGQVVLELKSRYWPFYLIASLPLIYHGYKKINKLF